MRAAERAHSCGLLGPGGGALLGCRLVPLRVPRKGGPEKRREDPRREDPRRGAGPEKRRRAGRRGAGVSGDDTRIGEAMPKTAGEGGLLP